ncbi:PREDICTED: histidine [Prunus dulcis]|uniref:PREDICTED: histidine n=1 Tax=Prunus dulcis TaxID=3755 RepID=A0A5E4GC01_PRUDU|nr:PREDICTED: histidine [Prunus dulcis]
MESEKPSFEPFRPFSSSGSGFLEQSEPPLPPPPPCVEVLPSEILPSVEPVELGGLTLLKVTSFFFISVWFPRKWSIVKKSYVNEYKISLLSFCTSLLSRKF